MRDKLEKLVPLVFESQCANALDMENVSRQGANIAGEQRVTLRAPGAKAGEFRLNRRGKGVQPEIEATVRKHFHNAPEFVPVTSGEHEFHLANNDGELVWRQICHLSMVAG